MCLYREKGLVRLPVCDGNGIREEQLGSDSLRMESFQSIGHQFPGIRPFPGAVAGPAAGQYHGDEPPSVPLQGAYIAVTCPVGKSGFSGQCSIHHMKKRIFVIDGELPGAGKVGKGPGRLPGDGKKIFPSHTGTHNTGQVLGRDGMSTTFIRSVEAVGGYKMGVVTAQIPGLLVHHGCKGFHTSTYMLSDGYGGIVMGLQHQGIAEIL